MFYAAKTVSTLLKLFLSKYFTNILNDLWDLTKISFKEMKGSVVLIIQTL